MLIEPNSATLSRRSDAFLRLGSAVGALVLHAASIAWGYGWQRERQALQSLRPAQTAAPAAAHLPHLLTLQAPPGREATLAQVSEVATQHGVSLLSVVADDGAQALVAWQARLVLQGDYSAIKAFIRELTQRHRALTWTAMQWRRLERPQVAGSAPPIEAQLSFAMMRLPRDGARAAAQAR
jgi:hypothetical protein